MNGLAVVLCPVDFTPASSAAVSLAEEICRKSGARLVLEYNLEPRPPSFLSTTWMWSEEFEEGERRKPESAEKRLQALVNDLAGRVRCEAKLTRGPIDESLLFLARQLPADLIVMATHGPSSAQHRSLTERLVETAPSAVLASVPGSGDAARLFAGDSRARALVYVGDGQGDRDAVRYALELAGTLPLDLTLVALASFAAAERASAEADLRALVPEGGPAEVRYRVESGDALPVLERLASETGANLILLAKHPRKLLRRQGHKTDVEVLHGSPVPVWFAP